MKMQEAAPGDFINQTYTQALELLGSRETIASELPQEEKDLLQVVLDYSEQARGVLTVVITSLVYKTLNPQQDIRLHQKGIRGGYSGRSFDTKFITPFLKQQKFPAMSESGWLTRGLEQKLPYDENYPGALKPKLVKDAFLAILSRIEGGADAVQYLLYLLQGLILQRNAQLIDLPKPASLPIRAILSLLEDHFQGPYIADGAARLPVLAIYSAYSCLVDEVRRYQGKTLLPIESHTSADKRSGRIGDVDLVDERGRQFEAVEVKYGIPIELKHVSDSYEKFQTTQVSRFYILTTAEPNYQGASDIDEEIRRISNGHGCQVIVNGVMPTLKYYLRLLDDTSEFIDTYVDLVEGDAALKFEHKNKWRELVRNMGS